jgi:hypothetical protein
MKDEVNFCSNAQDGLFWMAFEDLCKYFFSINVSLQHSSVLDERQLGGDWFDQRLPFTFDLERVPLHLQAARKQSSLLQSAELGSECFNVHTRMFLITAAVETRAYFSIHQQDRRDQGSDCRGQHSSQLNGNAYLDIGVTVLKIDSVSCSYEFVGAAATSVDRQNQTSELILQPGRYLCIPTTSGGAFIKQYAEALVAASKQIDKEPIRLVSKGAQGTIKLSQQMEETLEHLFQRLVDRA